MGISFNNLSYTFIYFNHHNFSGGLAENTVWWSKHKNPQGFVVTWFRSDIISSGVLQFKVIGQHRYSCCNRVAEESCWSKGDFAELSWALMTHAGFRNRCKLWDKHKYLGYKQYNRRDNLNFSTAFLMKYTVTRDEMFWLRSLIMIIFPFYRSLIMWK